MAREIYFFMTRDDLLCMLQKVEESIGVKYIENKAYYSKNIFVYDSLKDFESLGFNKTGNHQSESFLVLNKLDELYLEERQQYDGKMRYLADQSNNVDSVIFWPGGTYQDQFLICGHVGTISTSEKSKKILKVFQKYIKNQCKYKVGRYYFSDHVREISNEIRLITINVNEAKEYDLTIN